MGNEKEKFNVKQRAVVNFMLDTKFRVHRIILGLILILIAIIFTHIILRIVLLLFGFALIMSGIVKSCPVRERIKQRMLNS